MPYVTVWKRPGFDLIGMEVSYALAFFTKTVPLLRIPAPNQAGITINPGDAFIFLGGHKKSAGFTNIRFNPGGGLCYRGIYTNVVGDFVCFDEVRKSKIHKLEYPGYERLYFAWQIMESVPVRWFFTTRAISGRILETTVIERG